MQRLVLIAHNVRSALNVGSILRTADGMAVDEVILSGYTPYPTLSANDPRLPHERLRIARKIDKAALGAAVSQPWRRVTDVFAAIEALKQAGFTVAAVEQTPDSLQLPDYKPPEKLALLVGREVEGVEPEVLQVCDLALEIPMLGKKESYNVSQAAAMALYHCRFIVKR